MIRNINESINNYYNYEYSSLKSKGGVRRIVIFCILTTIVPAILIILPLYLRHVKYADVIYAVAESDIIEIHKGLSTVFCGSHSLKMNASFNAFQVENKRSVLSQTRKHIQLEKSMILPDDTLEYWGFFLLKGSTVQLKACSRFDGSNLLITKGEKKLNNCNLLNNYREKIDAVFAKEHDKLLVVIESETSTTPTISYPNEVSGDKIFIYNVSNINNIRVRRDIEDFNMGHDPDHIIDRGVNHGGNAMNYSEKTSAEKGASSFENDLLECHGGNILLNQEFPASVLCRNTSFLQSPPGSKMITTHEIDADGYYYYIFYSDNDLTYNRIHAVFDIFKPTIQYSNMSQSKSCINKTECSFSMSLWSTEIVIVEIPTTKGIVDNVDSYLLTSTCHPRTGIYILFPISLLLVILGFAYL